MSDVEDIKKLEAEIERKKAEQRKALESPFAAVGNAVIKRGPGRPPKEELNFSEAEIAHEQRLNLIKEPGENATSEELREFADKEYHKLIPTIVANDKWAVKYGDQKTRDAAGERVMRMLGIDRKDLANIGKGGQIVINMNGPANTLDIPLLKPVMKTVEGIVADTKKDGTK